MSILPFVPVWPARPLAYLDWAAGLLDIRLPAVEPAHDRAPKGPRWRDVGTDVRAPNAKRNRTPYCPGIHNRRALRYSKVGQGGFHSLQIYGGPLTSLSGLFVWDPAGARPGLGEWFRGCSTATVNFLLGRATREPARPVSILWPDLNFMV